MRRLNLNLALDPKDHDRFWSKVHKQTKPPHCWIWTASKNNTGYGQFSFNKIPRLAYNIAYHTLIGVPAEGLELDHTCRNKACVNPAHLEPVTHQENARRHHCLKTHCPQGHEFTPENTRISRGWRFCVTCATEKARAYKARNRKKLAQKELERYHQKRDEILARRRAAKANRISVLSESKP